jgi:hypothetical protein
MYLIGIIYVEINLVSVMIVERMRFDGIPPKLKPGLLLHQTTGLDLP